MITPSRAAAAAALLGVFEGGRRTPEDWDAKLEGQDAGLAQALLGLVLRRWGRLQAWVRPRLREGARGLPVPTQVALAQGLAQLAWLDGVADHAAVNESVTLVSSREWGFPPHRGLVNALLRQAASDRTSLRRELEGLPAALDRSPFAGEVLEAAVPPDRVSTLWERLQVPPRPAFRALRGDAPEDLEDSGDPPGCLRLREGAPFPKGWLQSGAGMVQDASSQALMAFSWQGAPKRILDACAAPGGKTTSLGLRFPGVPIVALEQDAARARRLEANLALRGIPAEVVCADAAGWLAGPGPAFDLILVDAPCTGSGTLGKHPELTWIGHRIPRPDLLRRQARILEAALPRLAPGGLLLYAVCSWLPEEGMAHRERLASTHPGFRSADIWGRRWGPPGAFRPDPLTWEGEGFQAFALAAPSPGGA